MLIINGVLLGVCLLYGLVISWIFNNGNNFNDIWIWVAFIEFVINHRFIQYRLQQAEDEEDE